MKRRRKPSSRALPGQWMGAGRRTRDKGVGRTRREKRRDQQDMTKDGTQDWTMEDDVMQEGNKTIKHKM